MLMKYSRDWKVFMERLDREYPQWGKSMMLPFPNDYSARDVYRVVFAQRALAASRAICLRLRADNFSARAFPPFDAPSADNACACGFFPSAGFKTSPMACSTTLTAIWARSARLPPLLARVRIRA